MEKRLIALLVLILLVTASVFTTLLFLVPDFTIGTFITPPGLLVIAVLMVGVIIAYSLVIWTWKSPRGPPEK
jgi:hypothetical protein